MEFIQNFHFMRPWFLLFLLLPIAILFKKIKTDRASSWEEVCDKHLLNFLIVSEDGLKKINLKKFIYIALVFASISAAGPSWKKIEVQSFSVENPNMFVLSLAQDMQLTDVSPSRLDRAKYIISDIADNISFQGQYGIIVYSDEPYLISPIADDINIIKSYLYQIVPDIVPDNGDRLDRAISLAIERFKSAGYSKGNIILLCSDVGQRLDLAIEKTKEAASLGYNINVIDVSYDGTDKLRLLADTGKGVYLRVFYSSINPIIDMMKKIDNKNVQQDKNLRTIYLDFGGITYGLK
jgi:Ca-activated chloride channel family protein